MSGQARDLSGEVVVWRSDCPGSHLAVCSAPGGGSLEEKAIQAAGVADRDDLQSESFFLLSGDDPSEGKGSSDLIIVFSELSRPHVSRSVE